MLMAKRKESKGYFNTHRQAQRIAFLPFQYIQATRKMSDVHQSVALYIISRDNWRTTSNYQSIKRYFDHIQITSQP